MGGQLSHLPTGGRATEARLAISRSPATSWIWVERRRWSARSTLRLSCFWKRPSMEAWVTGSASPKLVASRVAGLRGAEGWSSLRPQEVHHLKSYYDPNWYTEAPLMFNFRILVRFRTYLWGKKLQGLTLRAKY